MRGYLRQRSEGTWEISVETDADPLTGRRRRSQQTIKGTKREAQRVLTALQRGQDTGTLAAPGRETVGAWLDRHMAASKATLAPRTHERHSEVIRTHIRPALGAIRLSDLRPSHIAAAEAAWLEGGRVHGTGGLSPATVRLLHAVLRRALHRAVILQLIAVNPADAVVPPRVSRREMASLDADQAAALLEAARGSEFEVLLLTAIHTGLRLSELRGLRWSSVDLGTGRVSIVRTLQRRQDGSLSVHEPKTHRSRRAISLPADVVDVFREHRAAQTRARLLAGPAWEDADLVFADALGQPLSETRFRHAFRGLLSAAGLPRIRLHDLRHTMASLMLASGEHPKIVSERLGHSTVAITLDTYSHVTPGLQQAAAERLSGLLRGARRVEEAGN